MWAILCWPPREGLYSVKRMNEKHDPVSCLLAAMIDSIKYCSIFLLLKSLAAGLEQNEDITRGKWNCHVLDERHHAVGS